MRFQELRDKDGAVLARGLHPAIAVVAASAATRAAMLSALEGAAGVRALSPSDVDVALDEALRAAGIKHDKEVEETRDEVAAAERRLFEAGRAADQAVHDASAASQDLALYGELADRLGAAEEGYGAAVRAEAEAARSLAAAIGELDHLMGQRQSASSSVDQARSPRDSRSVPEAVVQQAVTVQAALASAEADKRRAVQQAEDFYRSARAASADALTALESAHADFRDGLSPLGPDAPNWGAGIPLSGLVTNHRDHLAARLATAQRFEREGREAEAAARARVEAGKVALAALVDGGVPAIDPVSVAVEWAEAQPGEAGEAVVANDAFGRLGPEGVAAVITVFAGRGCQVIYLTGDPAVLGWAIGLPNEAGAATTVAADISRHFSVVND